jgi:hypothetical protein
MKAAVAKHRKTLASINLQLSETPEAQAKRKREEIEMEQRSREADRMAEVNRIEI